jgi:uncharacterized protein YaaN involved in tellurite resistance
MAEEQVVATERDKNGILVIPENPDDEVNGLVAKIQHKLRASGEVRKITNEIDFRNQRSLIEYGSTPANEISSFSSKVLNTVKKSTLEDSSVMMKELAGIMDKFDPKDFEKDKGLLNKFFNNAKKAIEKILAKYQTIGGDIEKINIEMNKYKVELLQINQVLEDLYNSNFRYYELLEKYIVAGNMILEEVNKNELPKLEEKAQTGNQMDVIRLDDLKNRIELLSDRVNNLEGAKVVALQTAPQIRMIQKGNYKLTAKIQSAFIITIPLFKQALVQAITLKRQKIMKDSMDALDEATNRLLIQNANMTANQSREIAKMSTGSIDMETLENTWKTIKQGIIDTRAIEEENKIKREENVKKLHSIQEDVIHTISNQKTR